MNDTCFANSLSIIKDPDYKEFWRLGFKQMPKAFIMVFPHLPYFCSSNINWLKILKTMFFSFEFNSNDGSSSFRLEFLYE